MKYNSLYVSISLLLVCLVLQSGLSSVSLAPKNQFEILKASHFNNAIQLWNIWIKAGGDWNNKEYLDFKRNIEVSPFTFVHQFDATSALRQKETIFEIDNLLKDRGIDPDQFEERWPSTLYYVSLDYLFENVEQHGGNKALAILFFDEVKNQINVTVLDQGSGFEVDPQTKAPRITKLPYGGIKQRPDSPGKGSAIGLLTSISQSLTIVSKGHIWDYESGEKPVSIGSQITPSIGALVSFQIELDNLNPRQIELLDLQNSDLEERRLGLVQQVERSS